jgi:hypothetical protein
MAKDEVATKARTDNQSKKVMLTMMWSPHGIHVIARLLTGAKINSTNYTTHILQPLQRPSFRKGEIRIESD